MDEVITEIELHNSGSRERKRCRWRWHMSQVEGWRPRRTAAALFLGSAIDRALKAYYEVGSRYTKGFGKLEGDKLLDARETAGWSALTTYLELAPVGDMEEEDANRQRALNDLAISMWLTYLEDAPALDDFEVIITGRAFKGRLAKITHSELTAPVELFYAGEFDGLILREGRLYVLENKTAAQVHQFVNSLDRDEQAGRYHWAADKMVAAGALEDLGIDADTPVWGTLFNILAKRAPSEVKINKNGTISKAAVSYRVSDYVSALEKRGYKFDEKVPNGAKKLAPVLIAEASEWTVMPWLPSRGMKKPQRDALTEEWNEQHVPALLRLREVPWVVRVEINRNPDALQLIEQQLIEECRDEINLRLHPESCFRTPSFMCSMDCSFLEPCTAALAGQPIDQLLEQFFVRGETPEITEEPELGDDQDVGF